MHKNEHMCTHIYKQVSALKFTQKFMHIFTYIQLHISFICTHTHTHTNSHTNTHTYARTHTLTLIDMYTKQTNRYTFIFTLAHIHI